MKNTLAKKHLARKREKKVSPFLRDIISKELQNKQVVGSNLTTHGYATSLCYTVIGDNDTVRNVAEHHQYQAVSV